MNTLTDAKLKKYFSLGKDALAAALKASCKKGLEKVLGAATSKGNKLYLIIGSILGLGIIGYGIYAYRKRKQG